jgi:NAD(P)-dependent dehydrogenase (short-subunit alcohol dehydrogenase family)
MNLGLDGRRVLVTGASRGIGRVIALSFARENARVALTYHEDVEGAQETQRRSAPAETIRFRLDLTSEESVASVARDITDEWGGVDVLVNNAVVWPGFPADGERFETAPIERFRASLRANLEAHYLLTRALVGPMRDAGWGRVVHVSTGLVEDGFAGSSAYVAAKSGLHGLTRTMARELGGAGILTNLVMPGFTQSEGREIPEAVLARVCAGAATGRPTTPQDVANLVVFLGSAANTHVNGELVRVDGHFLAPS